MCGIAGIWYRDGRPVEESALHRMGAAVAHRGRDGDGLWRQGSVGFAHRRLSIIDLSDHGHQPMGTEDGRLWINFNGEIHNYPDLRAELEALGFVFRSSCDTEVALAAYRHWGVEAFNRFNGMWAIALWDAAREELVLCRDRFGIKPLMYSVRHDRLAFASEAKSILAAFPEEAEPDHKQLYAYLRDNVSDIDDATFYANIRMVRPATCLRIRRAGVESHRYWAFAPGREEPRAGATEMFRDLLTDATRIRLRSDVPVACWLSGGMDSSTITRIARSLSTSPLHCFSLRYEDARVDESEYAAAVADDPDAYVMHWVTPDPHPLLNVVDRIVRHHDSPSHHRGRLPMWFIARDTAPHAKVVLTGDGADEQLGGYVYFSGAYLWDLIRRPPPGVARDARIWWREYASLGEVRQHRYDNPLASTLIKPLLHRWGFRRRALSNICPPAYRRAHGATDWNMHPMGWARSASDRPCKSALNNALWREFTRRGLPEMLRGFDAVSMAHTLELRSPFLDHRVVEFCFSLPYYEKIGGGFTKRLLRNAFADALPPKVRNRKRKLGFPMPLDKWFRDERNVRDIHDALRDGESARTGLFDRRALERHLARHRTELPPARSAALAVALWHWTSVECWLRQLKAWRAGSAPGREPGDNP